MLEFDFLKLQSYFKVKGILLNKLIGSKTPRIQPKHKRIQPKYLVLYQKLFDEIMFLPNRSFK